jgi:hypothetical protein
MAQQVHITHIEDTWANIYANADHGQIAIVNNVTAALPYDEFVWKNDDNTKTYVGALQKYSTDGSAFTFLDNDFGDVTINDDLYVSEYLYHQGDTDSYDRWRADRKTTVIGSVEFWDFVEGGTDYAEFNAGEVDIDFIANANAVSNALFIEGSSGNIGIRTNTPAATLHVNRADATDTTLHITSGGTGDSVIRVLSPDGTTDSYLEIGNSGASTWFIGLDDDDADKLKISRTGVGTDDSVIIDRSDNIEFTGHVGIGVTPTTDKHLFIQDNAVDTTVTYHGIYNSHIKIAGTTDASDHVYGIHNIARMNDSGSTIGSLIADYNYVNTINGTITNLYGSYIESYAQAGNISSDVLGTYIYSRSALGSLNSLGGSLYGLYVKADAGFDPSGSAYGIYIESGSNIDYALYAEGKGFFGTAAGVGIELYESGGHDYITTAGSSISVLYLQDSVQTAQSVHLFNNVASGNTPELKISGYNAGAGGIEQMQIGVGKDANDTASFDGLSEYRFDGKVRANTIFNANGSDGLTGTLTLDDGANWRITLTFTGGILTAQTTGASVAALAQWV